MLAACAQQALEGRRTWELTLAEGDSVALSDLLDLGVLRGQAGRYRFRHPLIRDAIIVAAFGRDGPVELVRRLSRGQASYTVAFDALRSAFDASFSSVGLRRLGVEFSWSRLLDAALHAGLPASTVLAEAAPPGDLALAVICRVPVQEFFQDVWTARNSAWVCWLTSLPLSRRPPFIRRSAAAAQLFPLFYWAGDRGVDIELRRRVAERLRAWLRPGDGNGGVGRNACQLTKVVADVLPDEHTIRWLQALGGSPGLFMSCFKDLGKAADGELPVEPLVDAFLVSRDSHDPDDGLNELFTIGDEQGLLATQLRAGIRILFEMSARTVDGQGELVDDRWTYLVRCWEHQEWAAAWVEIADRCRSDDAYALIAVEEAARSRSRAARSCMIDLLAGTECQELLAPLLEGRSLEDVKAEFAQGEPAAPVPREARAGLHDDVAIFEIDDRLRSIFGVGEEQDPSAIGSVVGDLVVRAGRNAECDVLKEWLASWLDDATVELQRGRVRFIEACLEVASRVPEDDLDIESYSCVVLRLWDAWRRLDENAKHLGFDAELGWRLQSVSPEVRRTLAPALHPLVEAILREGSGMDLRGLDLSGYLEDVHDDTVEVLVRGLIRRVDDGPHTPHPRIKAFELAVQEIIRGAISMFNEPQLDAIMAMVERTPSVLGRSDLRRSLLTRARELAR